MEKIRAGHTRDAHWQILTKGLWEGGTIFGVYFVRQRGYLQGRLL